ncbi:Oidioi.mRNA.OKI2018_I69.chr2.g5842.t1.cds [Oikopleura dioica]|uniref:Oidioi.mRNA.OKI2018_I69.chr2.g5842.t1.cds n=1 Tax=Oikopleura dioica TaxID=34765 RepID=A0ABN7T852_OIKDI|nr:Oidioi.mRNA.OKI2018_I69.chr2.g5842.t1.cds [Oikopleura dioica]
MKILVAKSLIASAVAYDSYVSYGDYASSHGITCGGTITSEQTIVPPMIGPYYYADMVCTWNVLLDSSVTEFDLVAKNLPLNIIIIVPRYCGYSDPSTLRRKRDVAASARKEHSLSPRTGVEINRNGFTRRTVTGNTATITFNADGMMQYKGFEIDIVFDGGAGTETGDAAPTPADAWAQIDAAATDVAVRVDDFYAALPGLGANSVLASKKVARFNAFFAKMQKLNSLSSTDPCTYPAGSNDHTTFVAPVDSADACEELNGLFASLISFTDSFVCMPDADYDPIKLTRLIQRQRQMLVTRKLKQMKCGSA